MQKTSAKTVAKQMMKNEVRYTGVDIEKARHYLLSTMDMDQLKREGVHHLMPKKNDQGWQGRKPTIHMKQLSGPMKRSQE